jgi:hypothetical protein
MAFPCTLHTTHFIAILGAPKYTATLKIVVGKIHLVEARCVATKALLIIEELTGWSVGASRADGQGRYGLAGGIADEARH